MNMNIEEKEREIARMARVQNIFRHPLYQESLEKIRKAEKERIFCGHDMTHFLDVARLAYMFSLERGYEPSKEEIYAAALLHDIGRWRQYLDGTPHERASAEIAEGILLESGFSEAESGRILAAILSHRGAKGRLESSGENDAEQLSEVLYDADKLSRPCYACSARRECDWSEKKKNLQILW